MGFLQLFLKKNKKLIIFINVYLDKICIDHHQYYLHSKINNVEQNELLNLTSGRTSDTKGLFTTQTDSSTRHETI